MAQNPYVNKVEYAGQTLMDLTNDTATPSDVLNGTTFHDRSGAPQTGNLITHDVYDGLDSSSASDALSAKQGSVLNSKFSDIGAIEMGDTNSSTVSVNDDTGVLIGSVTISKGIWLVVGYANWAPNPTGYRQIAFNSNLKNPGRNAAVTTLPMDSKECYQQAVYIVNTLTGATINLYARQTSGAALNVFPYMCAIRFRVYE